MDRDNPVGAYSSIMALLPILGLSYIPPSGGPHVSTLVFRCPKSLIFQVLCRANLSCLQGKIIPTAEKALSAEPSLSHWFFIVGLRTTAVRGFIVTVTCRPNVMSGFVANLFFQVDQLHPEMAIVSEVMSS